MSKAGRLLSQAGRNVKRSLMDGVSDLTSGARKAAGAFADRFRKENIGATLRGGARTVAGAAGRSCCFNSWCFTKHGTSSRDDWKSNG